MEYLILSGQYEGNMREFGEMQESDQVRRKLYPIKDYLAWKKLDEMGKALYLANAQAERGIEATADGKKKAIAKLATNQVEKESSVETINTGAIESIDTVAITESDTIETINIEVSEELTESDTTEIEESVVAENATTANIEELRSEYLAKTGNKVPPRFSNNADWIKTKL